MLYSHTVSNLRSCAHRGSGTSAVYFALIEEMLARLAKRQARKHPQEGGTPERRLSRSESAENIDEKRRKIDRQGVADAYVHSF